MTETVWITGASGFSGRHVISLLDSLPAAPRIVAIDVVELADPRVDAFLRMELSDQMAVRTALKSEPPDFVIHLAGLMPPSRNIDMYRTNVGCTAVLASTLCLESRHKVRLLSIGSAAEYGVGKHMAREGDLCAPQGAYGESKVRQTQLALSFNSPNLDVVVARPFNLLGPGLPDKFVAGFLCRSVVENGSDSDIIEMRGSLDSIRDFLDIRDAVEAYWLLVQQGEAGSVYNVCSGQGTSIRSLVANFEKVVKRNFRVREQKSMQSAQADVSIGDNSKLTALGWQRKYPIEKSLDCMVRELTEKKRAR